jgi:hypothetical protein
MKYWFITILMLATTAQAQVRPIYLGWTDNTWFASSGKGARNHDESAYKRGAVFTPVGTASIQDHYYVGDTTGYFTSSLNVNPIVGTNQSFSVVFWYYCNITYSNPYFLGASDNANQWSFVFGHANATTNTWFQQYNGTLNPQYRGPGLQGIRQMTHIAGVRDGVAGQLKLYINGRLTTRTSGTDTGAASAYAFNRTLTLFGVDGGAGSDHEQSQIVSLRIYNRVLTEIEIGTMYMKGPKQ